MSTNLDNFWSDDNIQPTVNKGSKGIADTIKDLSNQLREAKGLSLEVNTYSSNSKPTKEKLNPLLAPSDEIGNLFADIFSIKSLTTKQAVDVLTVFYDPKIETSVVLGLNDSFETMNASNVAHDQEGLKTKVIHELKSPALRLIIEKIQDSDELFSFSGKTF